MMKKITKFCFTFIVFCFGFSMINAQTPIYTETFDGGLPADWTAMEVAGDGTPTAVWFWTEVGSSGPFQIGALESTTADNGWMIFDSDLNCSGNQDAWLTSPVFDWTDNTTFIVQFETLYRKFFDLPSIQASADGGATWTQVELFTDTGNNDFSSDFNPHVVSVDLTEFASGSSNFQFAFRFFSDPSIDAAGGCGYSWQIDDINVYDSDNTPPTDAELAHFFYSPASLATPISMVDIDTIGFYAFVANNGSEDLTNVVLTATVTNSNGDVMFEDNTEVGTMAPGTQDTVFIDGVWVPTGPDVVVDDYTITYAVTSDGDDATPLDNERSAPFILTEDLFSKEATGSTGGISAGTTGRMDANLYTTSPNILEDQYVALQATFSGSVNPADAPLEGKETTIVLLEVDESTILPDWSNFDVMADYISNTGLSLVSFILHTFTGDNGSLQTADLLDFTTGELGACLKPGNRYILGANYESGNTVVFHGYNENIFRDAFDPGISSMLYLEGDQWYTGGWADGPAAVLRMTIGLKTTTDETPLPESAMEIYPNPVSDQLNLKVDLEESGLANVVIADLTGKVIQLHEYTNLQNDEFQYNVGNLASGTYLIRLATESGTRTVKFTVVK